MHTHSLQLRDLRGLTDTQRHAVSNLSIDAQQIEYAGKIERILESAENGNQEQVVGLAVVDGDHVVGFLVLKRGGSAPRWASERTAVISGMRIDANRQGGGVGSHALTLLTPWLQSNWPECKELALSVDEENHRGINAYLRAGFQDSGKREQGRIGWVRFMSKAVEAGASSEA